MALRFVNDTANYLERNVAPLDYAADYTWMGWIYIVNDTADNVLFHGIGDGVLAAYDDIGLDPTHHLWAERADTSTISGSGTLLSLLTYYHVAVVGLVASLDIYLNGVLDFQVAGSRTVRGAAALHNVGAWGGFKWPFDGRMAYMRAWQTALTPTEILAEKNSATAVKSGVYADWRTPSGGTHADDFSGNARHWIEHGTITDEAQPSLGPPPAVDQEGFQFRNDDGQEFRMVA